MKYNIRRGVFETNSSSLHVISIGRKNWDNLPKIVTFQPARYYEGEGGDPHTVEGRASYLYTLMLCNFSFDKDEIWTGDDVENGKKFITKTLKKHGIEAIFLQPKKGKKYVSPIYSDNLAPLTKWLRMVLSSQYLLMQYLFSPDSVVGTCWDSGHERMTEEEEKKRYIDVTLG